MAEKPADSKVGSAVSSKPQLQNTSTSDSGMNEDGECRASTDSPKLTGDAIPKKRSTFKITGVVIGHATPNSRGGSGDLTADVDGDSLDDLDESHTEDFSSEMYDMSRTTELDQDVLLTPDEVSLIASKEKPDSQSRFKVVKIETKEPFRRGRWYCHDFLDTTVDKPDKQTDEITVHSGNSSAGNSVHYVHGVDDPSKNPLLAGGTGTIPVMTGTEPYIPVQGESFKPIHPAPHASQTVASQLINQPQRQSTPGLPGDSSQISSQVPNNSSVVGQLKPGMSSVQGGANQPSPGQSNSTTNVVPPNMNAQTVPHMPQSINVNLKQSELSQSSSVPGNLTGQVTNTMQPGAHYSESGFSSQNYNMTNTPGQTPSSQPPMGQGATPANVPKVNNTTSVEATPNVTQNPMVIPTQQSNAGATQTLKPALSSGNLAGMQLNHMSGQEPNMENIPTGDVVSSSTRRASVIGTTSTDQDGNPCTAEDLQNLVQESSGIPELAGPLLNAVSGRESPAKETKGGDSDSGSSAVAIDNKIEQAMDLVKSHLMFAVREEVEVLKEQIKELVEKITQLEYENSVLKAAATPETLAKLQTQKALPPSSSS